jgi:adenine phosphoribosyltransferase
VERFNFYRMNHAEQIEYLKNITRSIQDYPKAGIVFRDLTTIFQDPEAFSLAVEMMENALETQSQDLGSFEKFAGIEARGFVLAGALAARTKKGLVLLRKPGKLPHETLRMKYQLEYGEDALEIHKDAILPGERVVVVDDLLATGGTAEAACQLVEMLGGMVSKVLFLVELPDLQGRRKLSQYRVDAMFAFEGH